MLDAAHLGRFYGDKRTAITLDILCVRHVKQELLKRERDLFSMKWFDYRMLHPGKATYYFVSCMNRLTSEFEQRYKDHTRGYKGALKGADLFEADKGTVTGLWKARQAADELGIPYPTYVRAVYDEAIRTGWERMPRPTQFYSDRMLDAALTAWEKEQEGRLIVPTAEVYKAGSGFAHKTAFDQWWAMRVRPRPAAEFVIKAAIRDGWQSPESIVALGLDTIRF